VDDQWCEIAPTYRRFSDFAFPEWLYSASPWAGYREMASLYGIRKAGRAFVEWTGLAPRLQGRDGYTVFLPDEAKYDPERVATRMEGSAPHLANATGAPEGWIMPTLALMRGAIAGIPPATRLLLVVVPVNHRMIPEPGTPEAAVLAECERRVAAIAAARPRTALLDFMIASDITRHDENYWDPWHYRVGIAARIVADLDAALHGAASAEVRVLTRNGF
jgi:hypothetical protein